MLRERSLGVQLHPTSLPGGRLGAEAYGFVDWLAAAGARWWQVLPLNPPDDFGSPYASDSAFATWDDLLAEPEAPVDPSAARAFRDRERAWVDDWATFAGDAAIDAQVRFEVEWGALRSYAAARGVRIIGDVPIYVAADVRHRADCDRMVAATLDAFGDLDILFNNAGLGARGRLDEFSDDDWNLVIDTNLHGVYHGSRAALPHFLQKGRGCIIHTASTFGLLGTERYPAYCATKGAIVLLTKQMAIDYGPNIRVNCICPGATDTPMTGGVWRLPERAAELRRRVPLGRAAEAREIGSVACYLLSDDASYLNGQVVAVDGGATVR